MNSRWYPYNVYASDLELSEAQPPQGGVELPHNPEDVYQKGSYVITDQTGPADPNYECSCGSLIWDIPAHVGFHQLLGQLCRVERREQ